MEEQPTYQKIYDKIREDIYTRTLKPGDRLPGVREMSQSWHCTPGTVQHAYNLLVRNGLVISQQGKGTMVLDADLSQVPGKVNLRKASLVIRTEQFLLECATAGYTLEEITGALTLAAEHWRVIESAQDQPIQGTIRITGSSDTVINALAEYLHVILPGTRLEVQVAGSMSGLMALAQGNADMAGCHLWDAETDSYNLPFIRKVLPSRQLRVITFAHRRLGLITQAGNPKQIHTLADLAKSGIRFINRQNGSGTRVWLDAQLASMKIAPISIAGYEDEKATWKSPGRLRMAKQTPVWGWSHPRGHSNWIFSCSPAKGMTW
jgi:DNA-binding transcriptional regulator YhcF (GntR family)